MNNQRYVCIAGVCTLLVSGTAAQNGVELLRTNPQASDVFGATVEGDADRFVVGARGTNDRSGEVHVYRVVDGVWELEQSLVSPILEIGEGFGDGVSIDRDTMFVGASSSVIDNLSAGRVYVYNLINGVWTHVQTLEDAEPEDEAFFGGACSIDGDVAAVGSRHDPDGVHRSGSVFIYRRGEDGLWHQEAKVRAETPKTYGYFGHAIEIEGDRLVVGSIAGNGSAFESGTARVFDRVDGVWVQTTKLIPDSPQRFDDFFGIDVSLQGDTILIGARKVNITGVFDAGAAYIFRLVDDEWQHATTLFPSFPERLGQFGNKVSLSDDFAAIGWWFATRNKISGGACEIFRIRKDSATSVKIIYPDEPTQYGSMGHDIDVQGERFLLSAYEDDKYGHNSGTAWVLNLTGCRADINADGRLTPTDFTAWLAAFAASSEDCDQNQDKSCNTDDFTAWMRNYLDGCL